MNQLQTQIAKVRTDIGARFPTPTLVAHLSFITQELGELHDAALRNGLVEPQAYLRSRPKDLSVAEELGDLLSMTLSLCNVLNLDADQLINQTLAKWIARAEES